MRNKIATHILEHWGYRNITVGDIDGRNYAEYLKEFRANNNRVYLRKDTTYKTYQAVAHAYRLADIAISIFSEGV